MTPLRAAVRLGLAALAALTLAAGGSLKAEPPEARNPNVQPFSKKPLTTSCC